MAEQSKAKQSGVFKNPKQSKIKQSKVCFWLFLNFKFSTKSKAKQSKAKWSKARRQPCFVCLIEEKLEPIQNCPQNQPYLTPLMNLTCHPQDNFIKKIATTAKTYKSSTTDPSIVSTSETCSHSNSSIKFHTHHDLIELDTEIGNPPENFVKNTPIIAKLNSFSSTDIKPDDHVRSIEHNQNCPINLKSTDSNTSTSNSSPNTSSKLRPHVTKTPNLSNKPIGQRKSAQSHRCNFSRCTSVDTNSNNPESKSFSSSNSPRCSSDSQNAYKPSTSTKKCHSCLSTSHYTSHCPQFDILKMIRNDWLRNLSTRSPYLHKKLVRLDQLDTFYKKTRRYADPDFNPRKNNSRESKRCHYCPESNSHWTSQCNLVDIFDFSFYNWKEFVESRNPNFYDQMYFKLPQYFAKLIKHASIFYRNCLI